MQRKMIFVLAALVLPAAMPPASAAKKARVVPPSAHIVDADVVAFGDGLPSISEELHSYNGIDDDMSLEDIEGVIGTEEMERVLESHGITAPDRRKKLDMIVLCFSKKALEQKLKEEPSFFASALSRKVLKELDGKINPDDEQVVLRHWDYLEERLSDFFDDE